MLNENWRTQEEYTMKKKQRMTTMNKNSYVYGCVGLQNCLMYFD